MMREKYNYFKYISAFLLPLLFTLLFSASAEAFIYLDSSLISDNPDPVEWGEDVSFNATVISSTNVTAVNVTINGTTYHLSWVGNSSFFYYYNTTVNSSLIGPGTYTYTVEAINNDLDAYTATGTLEVQDTEKPVITVLGDDPATVEAGTTYTDAGAEATDNVDGNLTDSITATSDVNASVVGTYTVTYSVTDNAGNTGTATRAVEVVDTTAPTITSVTATANPVEYGDDVTITTTITDIGGVASAEVTVGGDTYTLSLTAADTYETEFFTSALTGTGNYTLTVTALDASGNSATDNTSETLEVEDTTEPLLADITATSQVEYGDDVTITATVTDILALDISSVLATLMGTEYPMTLSGTATYETTISTTDLGDTGNYSFTISAEDTSGNSATSDGTDSFEVVDTTAPAISALAVDPTEAPVYGESIIINATVTELLALDSVSVDIDGTAYSMTNVGGDLYQSSAINTSALGLGIHIYTVTANDTSGNTATASDIFVVIDIVDPTIAAVDASPNPAELGAEVTFSADVSDDIAVDSVVLTLNSTSNEYSMTFDGINYTVSVNSSDIGVGNATYTVTATDSFFNEAEMSSTIEIIDAEDPVITPSGDNPATVEAGAIYTDAGAEATDNVDGNLTDSITSTSDVDTSVVGNYSVNYSVTDSAGNTGTATRAVEVVDTTAPVVETPTAAPDPVTYGENSTITVTATDNYLVASVVLSIDGTSLSYSMTSTANPDEYAVSFNTTELGDIEIYTYTVTATDSEGTEGTNSGSFTVEDNTAPAISDVTATSPAEYGVDVTITAMIADDIAVNPDTLEVTVTGGTLTYAMSEVSSDTYEATIPTTNLGDTGNYSFTVSANDTSGNTATSDGTESFEVVDTTAPAISALAVDPTETPVYGESIIINATVTELLAIDTVSVDVNGTTYAMTNVEGDLYQSSAIDTSVLDLGTHNYTVTANDTSGNTATASDTFVVSDIIYPTIAAVDASPNPAELGAEVTFSADVSDDIAIDSVVLTINSTDSDYDMSFDGINYTVSVDSSEIGVGNATYTVTATDSFFNEAETSSIIEIIDAEDPIITPTGDNPATVEVGETYTDAGAEATDNVDGNLTDSITATSDVDTSVVGNYSVNYSVTDSAGNTGTATRAVEVVDTTAPTITVLGDNPAAVELNDVYVDAGAEATDAGDGNLTDSINSTSDVDTSTEGTYTVTYDVTDSEGNSATETREVVVADTIAPTIDSDSLVVDPDTRINQNDTVNFSVEVTDSNGIAAVTLTINGTEVNMTNTTDDTYVASFDTTGLDLGTYTYTITATDNYGNEETLTGTLTVTIVSPITVTIRADKTSGEAELDVSLTSAVSGGSGQLAYVWNFGDGHSDANKNVRHIYRKEGTFTVTLTIKDQYGNEGTDTVTITVGDKKESSDPRNSMRIDGISFKDDTVEAGDSLTTSVSLENIGEHRLRDVSVTVFIPELDVLASSSQDDVREGDTETFAVALDIPDDAAPGIYDVRIVISNDDMKRVKHRDIRIV